MKLEQKQKLAQRRRWRIRRKVRGTAERPRLTVHFSNQHIYAQAVDDATGKTIAYLSTLCRDQREKGLKPNVEGAVALATEFAGIAKNAGVTAVVFDRAGRRYHGCVKAFADAAREGGLEF